MKEYFDKLYKKGFDSFIEEMEDSLKNDKKRFIVTANPETFMIGEKDRGMAEILLDQDVSVVPDGIGIVKAAQMLDYNITERITGIDIAYRLLDAGHRMGKKIYLFGARQDVVDDMKEVLVRNYPKLEIVGSQNGYVKEKDAVFSDIKEKCPDIVLVALGIPLQEKLIYKHFDEFDKGIFVGVGGSFDVISGHKKRAPRIFIKLKLEWLYRIILEPQRLKRFYESNVKFIFRIRRYK